MITSKLMGGLGNMLFQISAGYALAKQNNFEYLINTTYTEITHGHSKPKSPNEYLNTIFRKLKEYNHSKQLYNIHESGFHYTPIQIPHDNVMLHGYYQSYKYFHEFRFDILDLFKINSNLLNELNIKYPVLQENVVSLHVRRGDYLLLSNFHHNLKTSYYKNAIEQFPVDTKFLLFSDDINWCKDTFVGDNYSFVETNDDITDLYLMSLCKHNIIANSTFSWWGAWLNRNIDKHVIYPNKWFGPANNNLITTDMFPPDWQAINE
jgi:hypothetical protein